MAVERGEKFGLLGHNGSGKSTTFKAIVTEILPNTGSIEIAGTDVHSSKDFVKMIGYCPQQHALFDYMTVEETINFYRKYKVVQLSTESIMKEFNLISYRNTYNANLSGGNKRKLNFCLALMFFPEIALLDEPTTGVDADARRTIWKIMNDIGKKKNFSMLLTTHTMEEAEMLCDRIGWMKDGNFIIIGAPEEIKLVYSQGYNLAVGFMIEEKNLVWETVKRDLEPLESMINLDIYKENHQHEIGWKENLYLLKNFVDTIYPLTDAIIWNNFENGVNFLKVELNNVSRGKFFETVMKMKNSERKFSVIDVGLEKLDDIFARFD